MYKKNDKFFDTYFLFNKFKKKISFRLSYKINEINKILLIEKNIKQI